MVGAAQMRSPLFVFAMNYLAHAYLSSDSPEMILGGMLGDFVKGSFQGRYAPEICRGIALHRQIDCFTDSHSVIRASKQIISPGRRRFAGIMIDLFCDHFLAKHWGRYWDQLSLWGTEGRVALPLPQRSLHDFSQHVYRTLLDRQEILPDRLRRILPYMVEQNWLTSYQDISNIGRALNGISQRLKRQNTLFNSVEELEQNYHFFEQTFEAFFPQLILFAKTAPCHS
jgi:acyl carrier protein phosphodiesterase